MNREEEARTMQAENDHDQVRAEVADAYEQALERSKTRQGGCCGPKSPAGFAAKLAGYSEDTEGLPNEAVYARADDRQHGAPEQQGQGALENRKDEARKTEQDEE